MRRTIHPTAIVSPKAQLGTNITIGPFSVVGANVQIGDGTTIGHRVTIEGWTTIGHNCQILHGAIIGTPPQDLRYKGEKTFVTIGEENIIREYVTVHRGNVEGSATYIGNRNFIMAYCHIAHNCWVGNNVIIANLGTLAGHVTVEDKAFVGGLAAAHQFVRIGTHAMVGACARMNKDIPPYTLAEGHPAVLRGLNVIGLVRSEFSVPTRNALHKAYRILFRSGLNTTQALETIEKDHDGVPEIAYLCNFIRTSKRGISKERNARE